MKKINEKNLKKIIILKIWKKNYKKILKKISNFKKKW